jgi:2',3'-cyclic-nucleotide 2'-phosphodiesterase (5'-nucleotidase family)
VPSASSDACEPSLYEGRAVAFDTQLAELIAPDIARAAAQREKRLGVEITSAIERSPRGESAAGNLVADLMRAARSNADVAIYNSGGLRADLPPGPLTFGALYRLLPFDNTMATIVLTAEDFGRVILRSLENGRSVPLSGLTGEVSCSPAGPTIAWRRPDGDAISPDTRLTVATSSFLIADGDGLFTGISGPRQIEPGPPIYEVIAEELTARGGSIRGDDPAIFDADDLRVKFPGSLPLRCETMSLSGR